MDLGKEGLIFRFRIKFTPNSTTRTSPSDSTDKDDDSDRNDGNKKLRQHCNFGLLAVDLRGMDRELACEND